MKTAVRVLLVAQDPMACAEIVSQQLSLVGLSTVPSFAVSEGEYVRQLMVGVDIVVWEHGHTGVTASQALTIPRTRELDVPVLVIGSQVDDEAILDYLRLGVTDVIRQEPYTRLGPAVQRALDERDVRIARRRTEAALRYSETRFRLIASMISDFAYVLRVMDDGMLAWEWTTDAPNRIKDFRLSDLPDNGGWTDLAHPDDREIVDAHYATLRAGGSSEAEFRIVTPDGSICYLRDQARAESDRWGLLIYGSVKDITEHKRNGQALRASEARFRQLFEHGADAVLVHDRAGRIVDANHLAYVSLGYDRTDLTGLTLADIDPTMTVERLEELWQVAQSGLPMTVESQHWRKDGSAFAVEARLSALTTSGQQLMLAVVRDVSARKRAEAELAATHDFLRAVIDTVGDPIFVKDEEHRWVLANRAFREMLGQTEDALIGKSDYDLLPREQADIFWEMDELTLGSETPIENEEEITVADGQVRTILTKKASFRRSDGTRLLTGVIRDVSERKRAEQVIRESEERYRRIVETSHEGILVSDAEHRIVFANGRIVEMFGWQLDEIIGRSVLTFVTPEEREQTQRRFDAGRTEARQQYGLKLKRKDGSDIWIAIAASTMFGANGEYQGRLAMIADVTERKRAEEELFQAQKLESVGRLAAGIAHEINTPIQFIGDNVHFLRDSFHDVEAVIEAAQALVDALEQGEPAEARLADLRAAAENSDLEFLSAEVPRAVEQTLDGVEQVASIVRAMKEFAHPDHQERIGVDLNQALTSTLIVARSEIKYVADVVTEFGNLPPVMCHPSAVNQVFLNLLVNAAHAVTDRLGSEGERGQITVRTRTDGAFAVIEVEDNGCGIPEQVGAKVFDQFFTTKSVGRGTGQGLALARRVIADQHGGSLTFTSEVGCGTTFSVRLPINGPRDAQGLSQEARSA